MLCIYEIATSDRQSYRVKQLDRPHAGHLTNQSLHTLIKQYRQTHGQIVVLLDEKRFVMAEHHHEITTSERYTTEALHQHCAGVHAGFRQEHHITGQLLYHYLHHITVDGQPSAYLVGQQGNLSRGSTSVYLRNETASLLSHHRDVVTVMPQSLATIHHIQTLIHKQSFAVVWIYDDYIKAVAIQDGAYLSSHTLNRGSKMLMDIITDNGVGAYFLDHNKKPNPLAEKLLHESFGFYCNTITQWLRDETPIGHDMILISDLIKHQGFVDVFQQKYHSDHQGYIVPLHVPPHEDKYLTYADIIYMMTYSDHIKTHVVTP